MIISSDNTYLYLVGSQNSYSYYSTDTDYFIGCFFTANGTVNWVRSGGTVAYEIFNGITLDSTDTFMYVTG